MRRQLVPGPVVRLTVIKAKTRPGIEATTNVEHSFTNSHFFRMQSQYGIGWLATRTLL